MLEGVTKALYNKWIYDSMLVRPLPRPRALAPPLFYVH